MRSQWKVFRLASRSDSLDSLKASVLSVHHSIWARTQTLCIRTLRNGHMSRSDVEWEAIVRVRG